MATIYAENASLVRALQVEYAPFYVAQCERALDALRAAPKTLAGKRVGGMPPSQGGKRTRDTGVYFVRPGQTSREQFTLDNVDALMDQLFYDTRWNDVEQHQRLETASSAVHMLYGYERGLRSSLKSLFGRYSQGQAFMEANAAVDDPDQRIELNEAIELLERIRADADGMTSVRSVELQRFLDKDWAGVKLLNA
jgi:hypothetical protein